MQAAVDSTSGSLICDSGFRAPLCWGWGPAEAFRGFSEAQTAPAGLLSRRIGSARTGVRYD